MPELQLDENREELKLIEMKEKKPYKVDQETTRYLFYYPGFTLQIKIHRKPWPKVIKYFVPTIVLGLFLWLTYYIEEYEDRLLSLCFCLLAFISILDSLRK